MLAQSLALIDGIILPPRVNDRHNKPHGDRAEQNLSLWNLHYNNSSPRIRFEGSFDGLGKEPIDLVIQEHESSRRT